MEEHLCVVCALTLSNFRLHNRLNYLIGCACIPSADPREPYSILPDRFSPILKRAGYETRPVSDDKRLASIYIPAL